MDDRAERLRQLLSARARLESADTDSVRLSAGRVDGLPGLIVDRFGPLVVAIDYAGTTADGLNATVLLDLVREACPGRHVVAKARSSADGTNKFATASHSPEGGSLPLVARERGLSFEIGLDPAHDFGIFLDAAKARLFVREAARGQRVLNLFSYTGAFGVAAAAGGATDVVNVDPTASTWPGRCATPRSTA